MTKFLDADINFEPDKITYVGDRHEGSELGNFPIEEEEILITHEWKSPLMKAHADYVTEMGGDILEIGFGQGLSAEFIQENNPKSHTIIEIHPQIAEKAREWASNKTNVTIIEGNWLDVMPKFTEGSIQVTAKKFDGIFIDAFSTPYKNITVNDIPKTILPHVKKNTRITHWNNLHFAGSSAAFLNKSDYTIEFDEIEIDTSKAPEGFIIEDTYYFPKVYLNV
tara:strand:- start:1489 stop:2157 length:669 start_codon:yes stop_codon:yes gene_type:complete